MDMKKLVEKLNINKNTASLPSLLEETQYDVTDDYMFQQFSFADGKKKHDMGFLLYDAHEDMISITLFDKDNESPDIDSLFWDFDLDIEEVLDMHKGVVLTNDKGVKIIRLW